MPHFNRRLPDAVLNRIGEIMAEHHWLADLMRRWRPGGQALDGVPGERGLRLAIRDGYLNFYRHGQSVAKVEFDASGAPRASIHNKYVQDGGTGQSYIRIKDGCWADPRDPAQTIAYTPGVVEEWITRAESYRGAEKNFVEEVVAQSPGVIDLEMALPALPGGRSAPRIDLVAVELDDSIASAITLKVVLWEVKRADDARARATGEPELVRQMAVYRDWLAHSDNKADVLRAYHETCRLLVLLARAVRPGVTLPLGPWVVQAGESWAPTLGTDRPTGAWMPIMLDPEPRILIDDCLSRSDSFIGNGHLAKLEGAPHDFTVQVARDADDLALADVYSLRAARKRRQQPAGQPS